jgi:adenosylmethionine---8-amino-7-oxononanoate aminotransferase
MKTAPAPLKVRSAAGVYLELEDGRRIVDCISSWWVNLHGHAHPYIAEAIANQARQLEHVIFAGFTHEPAEQLVRRLRAHLPQSLTRAFFSDNGSTAVEVALKMAHQYWRNIGQPDRNTFVGFEGGYHGDTVGAMSAGGSAAFWGEFKSLMFPIETVAYPYIEDDADIQSRESASLGTLRRLFQSKPNAYAGIIIEPLVQGASGMRMCRPEFLRDLARSSKCWLSLMR